LFTETTGYAGLMIVPEHTLRFVPDQIAIGVLAIVQVLLSRLKKINGRQGILVIPGAEDPKLAEFFRKNSPSNIEAISEPESKTVFGPKSRNGLLCLLRVHRGQFLALTH
jgi:hypothetical protein